MRSDMSRAYDDNIGSDIAVAASAATAFAQVATALEHLEHPKSGMVEKVEEARKRLEAQYPGRLGR